MCPRDDGRDSDEKMTLNPEDARRAGDDSAMSPDDLDIEDDENVVSLDEGRYVIGTDERPSVPGDGDGGGGAGAKASGGEQASSAPEPDLTDPSAPDPAQLDSENIKDALEADLSDVGAKYGFHITAKSEETVNHQRMFSDDVGTVFDSLLRWYAQQLTSETAVEDVLGILLTESNVRVRYSPSCLQVILESYDLGPDDTIADLFEAVQDDRGMVFPPENV